ncbi:MAG: inorganic diphosphatase [Patescibacteria group bacterium]
MDNYKQWLGKKVKVAIDRPLNSAHPDYPQNKYQTNYGFIPGTKSEADGEEIDAYILGPDKPLVNFDGIVIAVVLRENDGEIKLIVTDGADFSFEEIDRQIYYVEKYHPHKIVKK